MTHQQKLYQGTTHAAWGYLFLYLDIHLGTINLLPNFVGYLLFLSAIQLLQEERRDLALLRPLGMLIAAWYGAEWVFTLWGGSLDEWIPVVPLLVRLADLYFHFQLFTDFAALARTYKQPGDPLDRHLLICRTVQTLGLTGILAMRYLSEWLPEEWDYMVVILIPVGVITGLCLMMALFRLRGFFRGRGDDLPLRP